jgi:hypothetical protein
MGVHPFSSADCLLLLPQEVLTGDFGRTFLLSFLLISGIQTGRKRGTGREGSAGLQKAGRGCYTSQGPALGRPEWEWAVSYRRLAWDQTWLPGGLCTALVLGGGL